MCVGECLIFDCLFVYVCPCVFARIRTCVCFRFVCVLHVCVHLSFDLCVFLLCLCVCGDYMRGSVCLCVGLCDV